ncbi:hypothetical protein [Streptomyces acidiscabies]|uniref:DUF7178 family protein n=1 Tax=Streptomyces acidiscabies TaxID=42234 RepID=UPI0038F70A7F
MIATLSANKSWPQNRRLAYQAYKTGAPAGHAPEAVVIDRHAHDIAVGELYGRRDRGLGSARRYVMLAHCYREAALRLGELPSTVQAVTWVVLTERIAGTGTRPPREVTDPLEKLGEDRQLGTFPRRIGVNHDH